MYDVEITEGFGRRTVEKLGTYMNKPEAHKAIREWANAHPECGPCNPYWRFMYGKTDMVIDYGSFTHFGRIVYRNRDPQTAVKQEGATE